MQQHPIPQNVTAYKFRLVGSMTLKQFLELAAGIVTAWLIFSSGMHFLLKWTLGPLAGFFGVALAFIPVEDRPLDQWLINFIKAIYNPTLFTYQSRPKILDIFSPPKPVTTDASAPSTTEPGQLKAYLQSLPPSPTTAFDQAETKYLEHVQNLFGALGMKTSKPQPTDLNQAPPLKTSIKGVRVRKLNHPQLCLLPHATIYPSPDQTQTAAMPVNLKTPSQSPSEPKPVPPTKSPKPTKLKPTPPDKPSSSQPTPSPQPVKPPPQTGPVTQAAFATNIVFPQLDQKPNLISGVTLNQTNKIIPNVILEIKDNQGQPIRALKSNKLGQFFIATPIDDGIYQISAEHPDHKFAIMKLEAKGEIIPPLKIQSL